MLFRSKGFTLPRDTPKYNGTAKPEDWLADYVTAVNIAGGNKRVAVRYVPLMLQGSARPPWPPGASVDPLPSQHCPARRAG